ncbi:hypothetical protein AQJ23_05320 [Streptomyces antibioticus]|nr:hypothetical protein AQJ23_05320 [Streptomyces antibioticus]
MRRRVEHMKARADGERERTMRQLVLCEEEIAGAEVIPPHGEPEAPRPARGVRRAEGWRCGR